MNNNKSGKKKLSFDFKTEWPDSKVLESIRTIRKRLLLEMTFKTLIDKTKHEKAG